MVSISRRVTAEYVVHSPRQPHSHGEGFNAMCAGARLTFHKGYVAGRTAEFGQLLEDDVLFLRTGTALTSLLASGSGGKPGGTPLDGA